MKNKLKRILAWIGIILLIGMYLLTFFAALFDSSETKNLLKASVVLTIIVPVLLYAYSMIGKYLKGRNKN